MWTDTNSSDYTAPGESQRTITYVITCATSNEAFYKDEAQAAAEELRWQWRWDKEERLLLRREMGYFRALPWQHVPNTTAPRLPRIRLPGARRLATIAFQRKRRALLAKLKPRRKAEI